MILAGGSGTRLWPLARAARPKQFLPLWGGKSLYRLTYERMTSIVGANRVLVVAGRAHLAQIREQTPELPPGRLILEGVGRDTAPSVALAAVRLMTLRGDAIMVLAPSDHWIRGASRFRRTIRAAIDAVKRTDGLVVLGVKARAPNPGFGYVRPGKRCPGTRVMRVGRFVEKPEGPRARRFVQSGRWLWNCGVFVWRAGRILSELRIHCPAVLRVAGARPLPPPESPWVVPARFMRRSRAMPIDRAVLERSARVHVASGGFDWSDLGTWDSVALHLKQDGLGNAVLGETLVMGAGGCLSVNPGGLTVLSGVQDLIVIRSGDCVLVAPRGDAQRVRGVVATMGRRFSRWV